MGTGPAPGHGDITVHWHCGFQKTGTTAFQDLLRINLPALSRHAEVFPKRDHTKQLRKTAKKVLLTPGPAAEGRLRDAAQELLDQARAAGHRTVLISDENLLGTYIQDGQGDDIFGVAARVLPALEAAVAPARSEFYFVTRDFESWLKSAHNQEVKRRRCRLPLEAWRRDITLDPDWAVQAARLRAAVASPVHFFDMTEDTARGLVPGTRILEMIGIAPEAIAALTQPPRANESLTAGALKFMLEVNGSPLSDDDLRYIRAIVSRNPGCFR